MYISTVSRSIIYTDKVKADNPQTAEERVFKMTISNYYVREYLRLYREYRKVFNIFDAFLLYGKIEYTLGELRRDLSLDYQFHCALHDRLFNLSCRTCEKFGRTCEKFGKLKSQNNF